MARKVVDYDLGNVEGLIDALTEEWLSFRKLIPISDKLLALADKYNVKNIKNLTKEEKNTFPSIDFLQISSVEEMTDYLYDLSPKQMDSLLKLVVDERKEGIFYNCLSKWIRETRLKIRTNKKQKRYCYKNTEEIIEYEKSVSDEMNELEKIVLSEIKTNL